MKFSFSKSTVVQVLLLIVIILLAVNIILEKYYRFSTSADQKELPSPVINKRFLTSLKNYNIEPAWIIKKKITRGNDDSLEYNYKVEVPADLPASLLLREIQNQFDTIEINISASEFKSDGSTELQISSGGYLKLKALLKYNASIIRKTDTIGFALTGIEDLDSENLKNLLILPEHFAGIIIPSKHSQELLKLLLENQKEAGVFLNDDIPELEFRLSSGYSGRRLKNSVLSIIRKFHSAAFFIIDQNSDIYSSDHYRIILNEFSKRNITLITENKFADLTNSSYEEVVESLKLKADSKKLFMLSAEEFLEMPPVLAELRKTGCKFINPSALIEH